MTLERRISRVRRSTLILPVHVDRFVQRSWQRGADVIMLDLEDSVAPSAKAAARSAVRAAIPVAARGGATVTVRINHDSWREDIEASVWPGLSGVGFPKAESPTTLRAASERIERLERERGIEPGSVALSPAIETLEGLRNAEAIAGASPRITGVGGPAAVDFATDLGVELDPSLDQLEPARGELDLLSRALGGRGGGRWRSGQVITEYGDDDEPRVAAARAAGRDGSRGNTGIHPSVVGPFNRGYTPDDDAVREAEGMLEALETAWRDGRGWASVNGRRVPYRHIEAIRDYLAFARACREADARKAELMQQAEEYP